METQEEYKIDEIGIKLKSNRISSCVKHQIFYLVVITIIITAVVYLVICHEPKIRNRCGGGIQTWNSSEISDLNTNAFNQAIKNVTALV